MSVGLHAEIIDSKRETKQKGIPVLRTENAPFYMAERQGFEFGYIAAHTLSRRAPSTHSVTSPK